MDLVTLKPWVYPDSNGVDLYVPDDAVGRHYDPNITPTPPQFGVYQPEHVVENYSSLVWKEGYRTTGEFELKTNAIEYTQNLLPLGTLVSLLDTDEVFIVTTSHISTDESNVDTLTVTGIGLLPYLLENRPSWSYVDSGRDGEDSNAVTTVNLVFQIPDHMAFVIWGGVVFPHSEGGYPNTKKQFELPMNISVPHTAVSVSVRERGDYYRTKWPAPQETRLQTVSSLLELDQRYGIRTIRPTTNDAYIYTPRLNSLRGEGNMSEFESTDKMLFDIYQGVDRTKDGTNRIVFRHDGGDLIKAEYLSSIQGHKNFVNSYSEHKTVEPANLNRPPYHSELIWDGDDWVDNLHEPYTYSEDVSTDPLTRYNWIRLHSYRVPTTGTANIRATWRFNSTPLYVSSHVRETRITLNEETMGHWDHGGNRVRAGAWSSSGSVNDIFLSDGDNVSFWARATANNTNLRTLSRFSLSVDPSPHEDAFLTNEEKRNRVQGIDFRLGAVESKANTSEAGLTLENRSQIRSDGLEFLKEHGDIEMITADISPSATFKYRVDYNLGDVVWVLGKYGAQQKMVISEYTRTSDDTGISSFPTLVRYDEPLNE